MNFLLPQGIGDSVWALHKLRSAAKLLDADSVAVHLNFCPPLNSVQSRALDFVKRFPFVDSASMLPILIHGDKSIDDDGHYIYIPDGWTHYCGLEYYAMMPNGPLERGTRLEDWLPQFDIDWTTAQQFRFEQDELDYAANFKRTVGEYCIFYLGPFRGNMFEGHNRGSLWGHDDWAGLGRLIQENLNLKIVVVGADYDIEYWNYMMAPTLAKSKQRPWMNLIGELPIANTFAICKGSRFVISYQSGIGIFSSYLQVPTGIFWRPKGNSISPDVYLSFEESMASAWTRPDMLTEGKHLPLIYGRHDPEYIMNEILTRGW
jgi:hypothetical protein